MKSKPSWKNQFVCIEGNSEFHESVREVFIKDSSFKLMSCYQEVPVSDLVEGYPNQLHRVDWYIPNYNVILELHGNQHYKVTNRGGVSYNEAVRMFKQSKSRDIIKRESLIEAGYTFIEIPYKDRKKISATYLRERILGVR